MRRPPQLVTFDIDGTLLRSIGPKGNAAHHEAVNSAVRATFDISTTVADVPHAGSTDTAIIRRMCEVGGVPTSVIDTYLTAALDDAGARIDHLLDRNADYTHLVLPGVIPALEALKSRGVAVALATGNIENIAWVKLGAARLASYFTSGGFGNDAEERQDIVKLAVERSGKFPLQNVVHIGDALADVAVQHQIGVDSIGVLTGIFTRDQLEEENPLAVLDDLSDTDAFLRILGFAQ